MIQLEQQQQGEFVGGVGGVGWWLTPTTYIQLAGAGSILNKKQEVSIVNTRNVFQHTLSPKET